MELKTQDNLNEILVDTSEITSPQSSNFIEANTEKVSLDYLKDRCTIPVFAKDNETTISHYQFIDQTSKIVSEMYPNNPIATPDIRVSHVVKGRVPSAIGKSVRELDESEKTIYYERCAFLIKIGGKSAQINGNDLELTVGGVRAYNQENLYSKKSLEKFKMFIGYQNRVCTNLCISTDGFTNEIRIGSILDLREQIEELVSRYDEEKHLAGMRQLLKLEISEKQFAHWVGKARMFQHLNCDEQKDHFNLMLNDSHVNRMVKDYYSCPNFGRSENGNINLWNFYNLMTEANKSSYIDSNFERGLNCYEHVKHMGKSIEIGSRSWYLDN